MKRVHIRPMPSKILIPSLIPDMLYNFW
jgi:hypothetical protein